MELYALLGFFCFKIYKIWWSLCCLFPLVLLAYLSNQKEQCWCFREDQGKLCHSKRWVLSVLCKQCWSKVLKICSWGRVFILFFFFTSTEQYTCIIVDVEVLFLFSALFPFFPSTCSSKQNYLCFWKISLFSICIFKKCVYKSIKKIKFKQQQTTA